MEHDQSLITTLNMAYEETQPQFEARIRQYVDSQIEDHFRTNVRADIKWSDETNQVIAKILADPIDPAHVIEQQANRIASLRTDLLEAIKRAEILTLRELDNREKVEDLCNKLDNLCRTFDQEGTEMEWDSDAYVAFRKREVEDFSSDLTRALELAQDIDLGEEEATN